MKKSLYEAKYHIISFAVLMTMFVLLSLMSPAFAGAQTATSTDTTATTTSTTSTTTPNNIIQVISALANTNIPLCEITRSLKVGSSGADVRCLQRYLNWSGYTISSSGTGSPGLESTYFGTMTRDAVIRWQNANASQVLAPAGLTSGTGNFGTLSFNYYVTVVRSAFGM